ncbi:MAG: S-layer homology domain-containing protein [Clostridia bacterium]|nr:S-layer homology domain-containing protein [Clostridia bacterium]
MKRLISVIISLCLLSALLPAFAQEIVIELNELEYDAYMYGETVFVSGYSNAPVTVALYYPEDFAQQAKSILTYSSEELADGFEIVLGESGDPLWPEGVWTIIVQHGEVAEILEFTLSETVDRTEEPDDEPNDDEPTERPTKKPAGGNNSQSVTPIVPEKIKTTLHVGETEKINVDTSLSSLSVEIEDTSVVNATYSGKVLTITALKMGKSTIWLETSNNYANINVTVIPAVEIPTEEATEEITEPSAEEATEPSTEPVTEKPTEHPFTDLPDNHWAKDSILTLYKKGIINGMDSDTFAPDSSVTRAQFVTMLTKAFELKTESTSSPFNDVKENDWFFKAVMTAYDNSITQGDYAGNFNPNSLITREDMATLAYRTATSAGKKLPTGDAVLFDDHDLIRDYAVEAVYAMRSASVINGMTATTFEPAGFATRAQAATIIAKLLALK